MRFAVILSGCGQHDGSETHETVLTLLSLAQEGVTWDGFAPDMMQTHVTNHITEEQQPALQRNVLTESARLARGHVRSLSEMDVSSYDAIIFPGGMGAVTNLCNQFSPADTPFRFQEDVAAMIACCVSMKKPMGFICIAPIMIPHIYKNARLTIGNDSDLAAKIRVWGSEHVDCSATEVVIDVHHKVVSTPANMVAKRIDETYQGIHKLVKSLVVMVNEQAAATV